MKNHFAQLIACFAALLFLAGSILYGCTHAVPPLTTFSQDTETPAIEKLIDQAQAALESKKANPSDLLARPDYLPAHGWPRFRQLMRQHAQAAPLIIVTPEEPGSPLTVKGTVRDSNGQLLKNVIVYVYQTNSEGLYADDGRSGGQQHSRLFGYLLTDMAGRYELRTIRPGSYPQTTIQEHIHVEIEPQGNSERKLVTEIVFDDDKNLVGQARAQAVRAGYVIAKVTYDGQAQRTTADFQLP